MRANFYNSWEVRWLAFLRNFWGSSRVRRYLVRRLDRRDWVGWGWREEERLLGLVGLVESREMRD